MTRQIGYHGLSFRRCFAVILSCSWVALFTQGCSADWLNRGSAMADPNRTQNRLTSEETAEGWRLLFDGISTSGWRGFKKEEFPATGWVVEEGYLKHLAEGRGGDIITVETFKDFDLVFEWRIAPGGNSGVKYFIDESRNAAIGHEYQILDNERHPDARVGPNRQTAAFYDVLAPSNPPLRPAGELNQSRIRVQGETVEHWLNGKKVLKYTLESPELKAAIELSKFRQVAGFGSKVQGPILLQDHGDEVWFRNIKIREPTP